MRVAASMWIRDGVLVNRMHINPTAFAFCYWLFISPEQRHNLTIEELINFGFEKSGVSCLEKMKLFNEERQGPLERLVEAAQAYNSIATTAAETCTYFPGAPELLRSLLEQRAKNFITSAVDQSVLDLWLESNQGMVLKPYLQEVLGSRNLESGSTFRKGKGHFEYVSRMVNGEPIIYVADAPSEMRDALRFATEFNIVPIGFGYVIEPGHVVDAARVIHPIAIRYAEANNLSFDAPVEVDAYSLNLPDCKRVLEELHAAGAKHVVAGTESEVMDNLCDLLALERSRAPRL